MSDSSKNYIDEESIIAARRRLNEQKQKEEPIKKPIENQIVKQNDSSQKTYKVVTPENFKNQGEVISVKWFSGRGGVRNIAKELHIPKFNVSASNLVNKSIIVYGSSTFGKTTMLKYLLWILQRVFTIVFGFLPTNQQKHDFDSILHPAVIFEEEYTIDELKQIYQRQKAAAEIYNKVINVNNLHNLFLIVANQSDKNFFQNLNNIKHRAEVEIINSSASDEVKQEKKVQIDSMTHEKLINFYRSVILKNKKKLEAIGLNEDQKDIIKFLYLKPHIATLFDDATTEFKSIIKDGKKKNDQVIQDFFFKGRHAYITHMYGLHDDAGIDPEIRKNAHISIFCEETIAQGFFGKKANGFTADDQKKAEKVINEIFGISKRYPKTDPRHWIKMVYAKSDAYPFSYIIAEKHPDTEIKLLSDVARKFCDEAIRGAVHDKDKDKNPYNKKFK